MTNDHAPRERRRAGSRTRLVLIAAATTIAVGAGSVALGLRPVAQTSVSAGLPPADSGGPVAATASVLPTTGSPSAPVSASPSASASVAAKATPTKNEPRYGDVVDTADAVPAKNRKPGALPKRPETGVTAIGGTYMTPQAGYLGGAYPMFHSNENVVLSGKGYFTVRYEIAWFNRVGTMRMPVWSGLKGKLFHVASGGHRRMTDTHPGQAAGNTWMGTPETGYIALPVGAQQMWQNEFFYLDGTVTLTNIESGADYNIAANPTTWQGVTDDISQPAPADPVAAGWVRYGIVRDTGTDTAPVPQYCTPSIPADLTTVPRRSVV